MLPDGRVCEWAREGDRLIAETAVDRDSVIAVEFCGVYAVGLVVGGPHVIAYTKEEMAAAYMLEVSKHGVEGGIL